jgi:hypothetical protein
MVAAGVGRDSTAMLIGLKNQGIRPDAVLFADVGSEKEATYNYIPILRHWLKQVNFPDLTIVRYRPKKEGVPYTTIEGNCTCNATLPGAAFNRGSCTVKWKIEPQNDWTSGWAPAQKAWSEGRQVVKLIGFESTEGRRVNRAAHEGKGTKDAHKYDCHYPLMDWGWNLDRCIEEIRREGLIVPVKSACYFCPNSKPWEIAQLCSPEDRTGIMLMELAAEPYNAKVHGLWRRPVKKTGLPGSITEYILRERLPYMPFDEYLVKHPEMAILNPNCKKFKRGTPFLRPRPLNITPNHGPARWTELLRFEEPVPGGYTFNPPHYQIPLWSKVLRARLEMEALQPSACGGCSKLENDVHGQIIDSL